MFTGYAALAMAEALPDGRPGGRLRARPAGGGAGAGVLRRLPRRATACRVEVGPAQETLTRLAADGEVFDLVFLDADKPGYPGYLDLLLDGGLLADDGLLCVDNTLLQGEPWAGGAASVNGVAVAAFNERLRADPRVEQVVLPLRDGVTLVRKV